MRFAKVTVISGCVLTLFGCSSVGPDYSSFQAEARQRNVPILIYNSSWNEEGGRLAVWVANNQDKSIDSIKLTVGECGAKGNVDDSGPLILGGPFMGHTAYVSLPSWPIDAHFYPGAGLVYRDQAISSGHMIIQEIEIDYADGTRQSYQKDVGQLLTRNISNFCTNLMPR